MKQIILSTLMLLSIASYSQFQISSGINYSRFSNNGGYGRGNIGYAGGISDKIKLSNRWYLMPSISYEKKGAFNAYEGRNFNTHSLIAESFIGYRIRSVYIMASPYYERVLQGENYMFAGGNFQWGGGSKWRFWETDQVGVTGLVLIDLKGALLHFEISQGISQVRGELKDHTGNANYTLWKARNQVLGTRLVIPFNTFFE